jgi:hypothetical protein
MNTLMKIDQPATLNRGDAVVVLYQGRHNGWLGHFLRFRPDRAWAEIEDRAGVVQSYPVAWLRWPGLEAQASVLA